MQVKNIRITYTNFIFNLTIQKIKTMKKAIIITGVIIILSLTLYNVVVNGFQPS
jgi:hypothetical protein